MKKLVFIVAVFYMISCAQQKVDQKAEGEKLMQVSRDWAKVAGTKDLEKTLSYWDENAYMFMADHPTLHGKPAIRKMLEGTTKIPGFHITWDPQVVEVSESGDMAYIIENSTVSFNDSTGKPISKNNKAVTIWKKQADGQWKNVVDISTPVTN